MLNNKAHLNPVIIGAFIVVLAVGLFLLYTGKTGHEISVKLIVLFVLIAIAFQFVHLLVAGFEIPELIASVIVFALSIIVLRFVIGTGGDIASTVYNNIVLVTAVILALDFMQVVR